MDEDGGPARRDFFVSYNRADQAWARWIAYELEAAGYSVVFQEWDFQPGSNFLLEMDRATRVSDRTVAVLSPHYLEALYTQPEWAAALVRDPTGRERRLLPVLVEQCRIDGMLASVIHIDLVGLDESQARSRLRRQVAGVMEGRSKPSVPPRAPMERAGPMADRPRFPLLGPSVSNVPYRSNPDFTDRDSDLAQLAHQVINEDVAPAVQAIQGMGGIGKTALVTQYVHRHRSEFDVVWWVRAGESATLVGDYAGLASELQLPEARAADHQAAIWAVRRWLEGHDRWVLVLDNADDPLSTTGLRPPLAMLFDLVPPVVAGQVLITTRQRSWEDHAEVLALDVLDPEHARRFLLKRSGSDDERSAGEVAELLGHLALALEQAGAYVRQTGISLSGYLDRLRRFPTRMLGKGRPRHRDPTDTLATTWLVSLEQIEKVPGAPALLELAAFLAPTSIPRDLIGERAPELPEGINGLPGDPIELDEAVGALYGYGLLEADEKTLDVHPLIQEVVRGRLDAAKADRRTGQVIRLLAALFPEDPLRDIRSWPHCEFLLAHVLAAARHAEARAVEGRDTSWLLDRAAVYLQARGRYLEARELFERALTLAERCFPDAAGNRLNDLGYLLLEAGDHPTARDVLKHALAIEQAKEDPNQALVGTLYDNLGHAVLELGDPGLARVYLERGLEVREAVLGPVHADVAVSLNNLGQAVRVAQAEQAQRCFQRALSILRSAAGPDTRELGKLHHNLGLLLLERGDPAAARSHVEQALAIVEPLLGEDHPDVAKILQSLGSVLDELGDRPAARRHRDRAQAISTRNRGGV
jgi:tetratricopeptide (TPR) repeat protein